MNNITIEEGLPFDDVGHVLKWGINREQAWKIGSPEHYRVPDDFDRILWNQTVLAGLPCGILAYLPNDSTLDHLTLWYNDFKNNRKRDPLSSYAFMFNHLSYYIGVPKINK